MQTLNLIGIWKRQQPCTEYTSNEDQRWSIHFIFAFSFCFLPVKTNNIVFVYVSISLIHFLIGIVTRWSRDAIWIYFIGQDSRFQKNALFCCFAFGKSQIIIIKAWDWSTIQLYGISKTI